MINSTQNLVVKIPVALDLLWSKQYTTDDLFRSTYSEFISEKFSIPIDYIVDEQFLTISFPTEEEKLMFMLTHL